MALISPLVFDVVCYGNLWASVNAAVMARIYGDGKLRVGLITEQKHIGGIIANGLGVIDSGRYGRKQIDVLNLEFFRRLTERYGENARQYRTPPSAAEEIWSDMLRDYGVVVFTGYRLASLSKPVRSITTATFTGDQPLTVQAKIWNDCQKEGDLSKMAGVPTLSGREAMSEFGESLAGYRPSPWTFKAADTGDGAGGLIYGFRPAPIGLNVGDADDGVQVYTCRLPVTNNPRNMLPWTKPADYNEAYIEWRIRTMPYMLSSWRAQAYTSVGFGLFDVNGDFGFGVNWGWPDGMLSTRQDIQSLIICEQRSWAWFLSQDTRVAPEVRAEVNSYGLCKNELPDTSASPYGGTPAGFPYEVYVRAGRRIRGRYVMTQNDLQVSPLKSTSINPQYYSIDWHGAAQLPYVQDGVAGFIRDGLGSMDSSYLQVIPGYEVPYEAITPVETDCDNLLCPVPLSSTSVAYGSCRIDIDEAARGTAAGLASAICADLSIPVQQLDVATLQAALVAAGHPIHYTG